MKADSVVSRLSEWMFNKPLLETKHRVSPEPKQHFQPAMYSHLALDIATAANINEELPKLLAPFQKMIGNSFHEALNASLYLALNHSPEKIELVTSVPKDSDKTLQTELVLLLSQPHADFAFGQSMGMNSGPRSIYIQTLGAEAYTTSGWMILTFDGPAAPSSHLIKRICKDLNHALTQGIAGAQKQQQRIEQAISEERAEQGAELHDSMAQQLGYLRMKTARLASTCKKHGYTDLEKTTEDLATQTHCAYRQARELIVNARLSMTHSSLATAISETIEELEQQSGIVFELDNRIEIIPCCTHQTTQVLYIVREALHNVVRHSHATHARVVLMPSEHKRFIARVEDNGKGFDSGHPRNDSFGLRIMQERAEKIGADLKIGERPEGGVKVELTVSPNAS